MNRLNDERKERKNFQVRCWVTAWVAVFDPASRTVLRAVPCAMLRLGWVCQVVEARKQEPILVGNDCRDPV